ncbi:unnamed protein product [Amaranthus hypochondriacus]
MENLGNSRSISKDQVYVNSPEVKYASRTRHGTKLRDILMSDKPNLLYADFHHEITRNPTASFPKHIGSQQSEVLDRRASKEEELVRYMSNLPNYLEKGKSFQDKPLNVGVLDWRRLEKWRYSQKQMPGKLNEGSPSSSTTSLFSTDGSSTHSSRGLSSSPARQRVRRLSLQSQLEASPKDTYLGDAKSSSGRGHSCSPARQRTQATVLQSQPQNVYTGARTPEIEVFGGKAHKFCDSPVIGCNNLNRQRRAFGAVEQSARPESDMKAVPEVVKRPTFDKYEVGAPWKGKSKIQSVECATETMRLQGIKLSSVNQDCTIREKTGVVMHKDLPEHGSSLADMPSLTADGRLSVEPCQKSILGIENHQEQLFKNDQRKYLQSLETCPLHADGVKSSFQLSSLPPHSTKMVHSSSKDNARKGAPQASHMLSIPARMFSSPSRSRNAEEKKPIAGSRSGTAVKPSEDSNARKRSESIPKARNPSPIRRLSSAMGKMIKNAGSRENSPVRRIIRNVGSRDNSPVCRSSSTECIVRSRPEEVVVSKSNYSSYCDKSFINNNRSRSSPIRRLFDPLLKPRTSNCSEQSKKHSSRTAGTINSCSEPLDFCVGNSIKVNSRPSGGITTLLQALLRVSFKNGLPLFTFAIDNESNILAATVRKSRVPGKSHHSWTYTFFTIREVKRRSGMWLNQGGKGNGQGYVPNVVAQMKVSDSPVFTKQGSSLHNITREFDLFAVDVGNGDQYTTDFHPTNELAAIVIKLPGIADPNEGKDDQSSYDWLDFSQDSRENLQEMRPADSSDPSLINLNLNSTVILPGGVHTVPSKGEISTLAERWRSGGSCDCGGWDLGCQLRVYTNKKEYESKMGSSGVNQNKNKFQIFSQGNQDNQLVLSLAPFKERIHSVEFSSSLSLLQAFAICISLIDCKRPPELSEPSSVEKFSHEASIFDVAMRSKTSNQDEPPARYVSYPPHSPVGRV